MSHVCIIKNTLIYKDKIFKLLEFIGTPESNYVTPVTHAV